MAEVKFCGLTREVDVELACQLGALYVGVIFAGGPRELSVARAREVLGPVKSLNTKRAGVFGSQGVDEILRVAEEVELDVIQLHGGSAPAGIEQLAARFEGDLWLVLRGTTGEIPADVRAMTGFLDAIVLDSASAGGRLGGTGIALDWELVARGVSDWRGSAQRLVLAGGLRPENVGRAIEIVGPDIVDVSSGVESSTGVKDGQLMRAFYGAAKGMDEGAATV